MASRKRIDKASGTIMKNIVVLSIISCILNTVLLCISASKESWMFGEVACQIHAIVCYVLLSSIAWLTTLAAVERLYKCVSSGSYSMTFSEINTRLLIVGMYMTAFFLCTGPMYGWGEFSQYRGLLMIKVKLLSKYTSSLSTEFLCNKSLVDAELQNIHSVAQVISDNLQNKWNMYVRSMNAVCNTGDIYLTTRVRDASSLSLLLEADDSQHSLDSLQTLMAHFDFNVTKTFTPSLVIDRNNIENYRNVLLPFQSLGVCTLDFSTVNLYKRSATYYIFGTTLILPCIIAAICGLIVLFQYYSGSIPANTSYFKIIYLGGMFSFVMCLPYYVVNFMNGSGKFIPRHLNFMSTFLYYNSSLCLIVPYLIHRKPTCKKPKDQETMSSCSNIQDEIQVDNEWSNCKVDYV